MWSKFQLLYIGCRRLVKTLKKKKNVLSNIVVTNIGFSPNTQLFFYFYSATPLATFLMTEGLKGYTLLGTSLLFPPKSRTCLKCDAKFLLGSWYYPFMDTGFDYANDLCIQNALRCRLDSIKILTSWDLSMCIFIGFVSCSFEDISLDEVIPAIAFCYINIPAWFLTCFPTVDYGFDYPNDLCVQNAFFNAD